jgi:DNA polymerase delta subunit 3
MADIRNIIFTLLSKYFTDQVIRVPRNPPSTTNPSTASGSPPLEDVEEDVDVEMAAADEDLKIKPPPRKRKPKKVIPVGRNGLKKRRVEKSRTSFDEKGYMGGFFVCLLCCSF